MNISWHHISSWVVLLDQQEAKFRSVMGWIKSEWVWRWSDLDGGSWMESKVHWSITLSHVGHWAKFPKSEMLVCLTCGHKTPPSVQTLGKRVPASPWTGQLREQTHRHSGNVSAVQRTPVYVRKSQVLRAVQILGELLSRVTHAFAGNWGQPMKLNS